MSFFYTTEIADFHGLQIITIKSKALRKRADITVYNGCEKESSLRSVPLVILLHGVYGSHWAWSAKGMAHKTLQTLISKGDVAPMILAMPSDGLFGDGSGYVPHKQENYEKWIVEDVITVMKEQFAQIDDDSPIFIAGLSMGGFGALRLGAKYPTIFKGFSGLSSITHFNQLSEFVEDFEALKSSALEKDGVIDWMIANQKKLSPFRFDCGNNDPLIEFNRQLHLELNIHQILHIYKEFAGEHSWEYWCEHLEETLLFFNEIHASLIKK